MKSNESLKRKKIDIFAISFHVISKNFFVNAKMNATGFKYQVDFSGISFHIFLTTEQELHQPGMPTGILFILPVEQVLNEYFNYIKMTAIKIVYIANIIVAGWIGIISLFFPKLSSATIFQNAYPTTGIIKLVGCMWLAIAILSVFGLWRPLTFSPVLLMQLIYKSSWLLVVAIPAILNNQPFPSGMAAFFLVWVLFLPLVIPWTDLPRSEDANYFRHIP